MVKVDRRVWKEKYFNKLRALVAEYPKILLVSVNNVGSKQMQEIRMALRGQAEVLMGKNTMIRKVLNELLEANPGFEALIEHIKGNISFVFTKGDTRAIRDLVVSNKVKAPARAGAFSPIDVIIPKGVTTLDAQKTTFFQALNIPTKIAKGNIEIVNDVHILKPGARVGASEAALLNMLGVSPFSYGLELLMVYDAGSLFSPEVLDITDDAILAKFMAGVANVAAVSLEIGYPTIASVPHSIINGYKNVLAVALATEITFPLAQKAKDYIADPSKFAVAAAPAAAAAAPAAKAAAAPAKEEPKEDSDAGMDGFGLFD